LKRHQTTILDIARELNLSKSTVSRALTGHKNVKPATRKAVLELAEKLDYERNMLAISLVKSKSSTIGVIVPEFLTPFFPQIIDGITKYAQPAGYNVLITQSGESYEAEVANTKVLLASQVDGILISLTKETQNFEHFKIFQRKGIPIVFFNRVCEDMEVPKVIVDDYDGAFRAVDHLIKSGKRRIAHLAGPNTLQISRKRLNGYKAALIKHKIPVDEELIISYDLSEEKARIYVNHLLSLPKPPDALFAINDPTAISAIEVIKSKGLKIPRDIAVIGFSNDYAGELMEPSLTTVSQPLREMGQVAAQLLIDQIEKDTTKPIIKLLKTKLIVRNSA
jgi:DNA-binding LacI/PurR family transcriptional regulator